MSPFRYMPITSAQLFAQPIWHMVRASSMVYLLLLLLFLTGTHLSVRLLMSLVGQDMHKNLVNLKK